MNNLIVKEDVIKIIKDADVFVAYHEKDPIEEAVDRAIRATKRSVIYDIEILLPVQIQKKGEWIDTGSGQECSVCGEIQYDYDNYRHFCANCGADMRTKETDCDYEQAVEQLEHDMLYEPTFNQDDGSV